MLTDAVADWMGSSCAVAGDHVLAGCVRFVCTRCVCSATSVASACLFFSPYFTSSETAGCVVLFLVVLFGFTSSGRGHGSTSKLERYDDASRARGSWSIFKQRPRLNLRHPNMHRIVRYVPCCLSTFPTDNRCLYESIHEAPYLLPLRSLRPHPLICN